MRTLRRPFLAILFACVLARSSSAWAQLDIGVDRSLLSAQSAAVEEKAFKDIRAVGAIWFRDGPTRGSSQGIANFVDEVRRAKENHLKALMPLVQMDEDYDGPLPTNQYGWKEKKMSAINLDKFATRVRRLLDALKGAGLMIDAVQLGNGDDLYCYDADVPNGHAATRAEIATWLRGYGQFLKTGAKIVHEPRYYPEAKTAKAAG